ncbi:branched-chain-amino-acid aminotransferase (macronuclear) [Tetrahymena thermophila SB210]|uniref:Branched-chain-amino-acid aminotransferase n=1 Tax=Tetrahymena thermophila (strain SB210) TaxID=312017 RepID=I7M483_TETTS|nr:branched-chain-amino-acid aminotransferase [Tetrahymena thermophila SB210]EAS05142.1 branched-chain-amino-acid aminotransferase [Tetrahymena thermophila SB210]|eukprot:XP_001025387.1 branched-chain-amino-acid aminotransferase [Tetrahymena thermophila SB210]
MHLLKSFVPKNCSQAMSISNLAKRAFSTSYYANMDLSSKQTFYRKDLTIELTKNPIPMPEFDAEKLRFGAHGTDHMLSVDFDSKKGGWGKPYIHPFRNLEMHPFNSAIHYAMQCFEGAKAFKGTDGKIRMFRVRNNMYRLKNSCKSLALPDFDGEELYKCIEEYVKIDEKWIPPIRGFSLYIRPTVIAWEDKLGVRPADKAKLFVVFSPVGPYYPSGFKPIKLFTETKRIRAAPGGTGNMKVGGNYAPTIPISQNAEQKGFQQVLWLWQDSILEVGTSNIFFFWVNEQGEKELVTPYLDEGTILPGVMRDSILSLTRKWKEFKVTERRITIDEVVKAAKEGRLIEAFGAGTAVIVCPIEEFNYQGVTYKVPINPKKQAGDLTYKISETIQNIQYGDTPHEWAPIVN